MKQGKKLYRKAWSGTEMQSIFVSKDSLFSLICDDVFADDWEIYEEPLKVPEMTAEKAITLLNKAILVIAESGVKRIGCCTSENIIGAIQFAIRSLENQNQTKLFFDVGNISEKELEELHRKFKECKLEVNPEKECDCKCNENCTHGKEGRTYYSDGNAESVINRFTSRLLKDYDKECRQQSEHIRNLEEKQEERLEENSVLRERLELLENENRTLHEIINKIRVVAESRRT
jgi:hypothetical protein